MALVNLVVVKRERRYASGYWRAIVICFLMGLPFALHAQKKIGLLLCDFGADRWYLDQKLILDRLESLGAECRIEIASTPDQQLSLAKKLINERIAVLIVVPLDSKLSSSIVATAKKSRVPVIAYDRFILSSDVALYISYDNEKVGELQAEYALKRAPTGNYVLINGPTSDNNAVLFRQGQLKRLNNEIQNGQIKILSDIVLSEWSDTEAFKKTSQFFGSGQKNPDVILVANDYIANAVIHALPANLVGKVVISGQDADLTGISNIESGAQAFTVYKPIKPLAFLAAEAAVEMASGRPTKNYSKFTSGNFSTDAVLLEPIIVDSSNYRETVLKDRHASQLEVVNNLRSVINQRDRELLTILQKQRLLEVQNEKNKQDIVSIVALFLVSTLLGLTYMVYSKQKTNRLLNQKNNEIAASNTHLQNYNNQLALLNEEMLAKQEEISTQRDAIKLQNESLQKINEVVARQKEEIELNNQNLEIEVRDRTAELVRYSQQLEEYAMLTAHNLRAPLARIMGLSNLMKIGSPDELNLLLDKLAVATSELDAVIKDLNAIVDIRTVFSNELIPVKMDQLVQKVVADIQQDIDRTKATIEYDFKEVTSIRSVERYLYSILLNLIGNSLKYRSPERRPVVKLTLEKSADQICLTVSDNGLGIDLSQFGNEIFRLHKRFHPHVFGRGVGLFLVKTLVKSLGGDISVESVVNKGTTFRVFFSRESAQDFKVN